MSASCGLRVLDFGLFVFEMLKSKSFLAVDCGANTLKLAEFESNESGGLRLKRYAFKSLGLEGAQESTREAAMIKALEEILADKSFSSKKISICAPGFHVFSKFVKLPPVDATKVTQIIQYEAQQNVPFPLDDVVWDYQILGTSAGGDLEVLLVAIKTDVVEGLFRAGETVGLRPQIVDVSPAALCNAFRFNYGDIDGCTMVLDIGAKTSNLLFFEKGRVYSRSINIGANSITQDFAHESKLGFAEAEAVKVEKGFVSLGGAYEEPDDPQAAAISKIARQVMTRLHIQVNQTVQFYRGQQGGSAPQRLFLSGGASVLPYTAQFFQEKLNLPVEYFNPFRNIEIDSSINLEELAKVAHSMGEVVGLGLRSLAHCPVELNLMPKSSVKRQEFNQKKPYFLATVFSLVLVVFSYDILQQKLMEVKRGELESLQARFQPLVSKRQTLEKQQRALEGDVQDAELVQVWLEDRYFWPELLPVLRQCLIQTEIETKEAHKVEAGIWLEKLYTEMPAIAPGTQMTAPIGRKRRGAPPPPPVDASGNPGTVVTPVEGLAISNIILTVRAVDMTSVDPSGNTKMAFTLLSHLQAQHHLFDTNGTVFRGTITGNSNTFSTEINLKLKRPLTL